MLKALIKSMRLRQWPKNLFVMAAVIFDGKLTNFKALMITFAGVLIFCLISSSVYLINDIRDVEYDCNHPVKKFRPIASGKLPIKVALIAAIALLVISFPCAYLLAPNFAFVAVAYCFINLLYSAYLKHVPLIDVLIIAAGFVLRVGAGVTLINVQRFSPWLYVVTTLLALYIGFGKRRAELNLLTTEANNHRRVLDGYSIPFLDQLITIVSSCTILAYSLYTFSAPNLPANHAMMLTIPFVMYGIFRYLYLIQIKGEGGAPEDLLLTDRPLQVTIFLFGLAVLLVFYVVQ
jgi:4-hydroxybenzoate polyprenyltransferase